jgi:hypothetical protein
MMPRYKKYANETPEQAKKRIAKNKKEDKKLFDGVKKKRKRRMYEDGDDYNDYVLSGE